MDEGYGCAGERPMLCMALVLNCGKAYLMISNTLKRKLRGFPTSGLSVRVVGS